jgi:hypothetical protein
MSNSSKGYSKSIGPSFISELNCNISKDSHPEEVSRLVKVYQLENGFPTGMYFSTGKAI